MEWADAGDWNRQVATVRSFLAFCRRRCWLIDDLTVDLERRPEPADRTKAIPLPELERLWRREDVSVREKALWRLLYETAARASEALAINVETWSWRTSGCGSAPRAATPTGCTSRPARPGCCRG
jgi:integrase